MRTQLRIVAGAFRGRKLTCTVNPRLRPTPEMVRQALFNILGNAVPDRPFFDLFAGTGVVGLEAISRGARSVTFVERDFRQLGDIERHVRTLDVTDQATLMRADVYRWAERWPAPAEPVNVFVSPPFADFEHRLDEFLTLVRQLQHKVHPGSVLVIQGERDAIKDQLQDLPEWEQRRYGRNELLLWVREEHTLEETPDVAGT